MEPIDGQSPQKEPSDAPAAGHLMENLSPHKKGGAKDSAKELGFPPFFVPGIGKRLAFSIVLLCPLHLCALLLILFDSYSDASDLARWLSNAVLALCWLFGVPFHAIVKLSIAAIIIVIVYFAYPGTHLLSTDVFAFLSLFELGLIHFVRPKRSKHVP